MVHIPSAAATHRIDRRIYGQFAEHLGRSIYEGVWVGAESGIPNKNGIRTDVVDALRHIKVPLVRWPGGCFADEYHWLKGVGPDRQAMVNTHWGGVVEPNEFGTHEYFELLNQLDAEAYINGNVGSGTVAEMHDWIEYMTLDSTAPMAELRKRHGREQPWKVEFFGVGNESWGCGGNMLPLHYANQYRQYQTYVRQYGESPVSQDRVRSELGRLRVDGSAHGQGRRAHGRAQPALLHDPHGRMEREGRCHRVRRLRVVRDPSPDAPHGGAHPPAQRNHGQVRPEQARRVSSSTNGGPGTTSSREPTRASSTSRTPSGTRWWPR